MHLCCVSLWGACCIISVYIKLTHISYFHILSTGWCVGNCQVSIHNLQLHVMFLELTIIRMFNTWGFLVPFSISEYSGSLIVVVLTLVYVGSALTVLYFASSICLCMNIAFECPFEISQMALPLHTYCFFEGDWLPDCEIFLSIHYP